MKLGPVTKLDIRNTARSKNIDEILESCDVIINFLITANLEAGF